MKISYNLTVEDWVAFQEYYRKKRSPLYGCMMPILTLLLACNVIIGFYMVFIYQGAREYNWLFVICIIILGYLLFLNSRIRRRLTKAGNALKEKNPETFGETSMEFFEEGFEVKTANHRKFLNWEDIEEYDEKRDYIYFFSKKQLVYILPRRDVPDEPRLMLILNQYLQNDKHKKTK